MDDLSPSDRLILEVTRSIREDFLHQNSFDEVDTYTSLHKQYRMLGLILGFKAQAQRALNAGVSIQKVISLPVMEKIGRAKYVVEADVDSAYDAIEKEVVAEIDELIKKGVEEL